VLSPIVSTDSEGMAYSQMTSAGVDGNVRGWRYVEPIRMDDQSSR